MRVLPLGEDDLRPAYETTKPLGREGVYYFRKSVNLIKPQLFLSADREISQSAKEAQRKCLYPASGDKSLKCSFPTLRTSSQ